MISRFSSGVARRISRTCRSQHFPKIATAGVSAVEQGFYVFVVLHPNALAAVVAPNPRTALRG